MEQVNKRILIHSIVFSPDGVSTAYLYNDIAVKLKKDGFEVIVLTTTPHYNRIGEEIEKQQLAPKFWGLFYLSYFNGIKVYHVPQKKFNSVILRGFGMLHWHLMSIIISFFLKKINVIISPSPPLTIGLVSILIAKIKGAKSIYNVQEIYPDFFLNQGKLNFKPLVKLLKWLERWVYNHSDAVTTIDDVFYNKIKNRIDNPEKLTIIPNFVDTDLYFPVSPNNLDPIIFPNKPDVLKLMYAGNIGHAQDWEPLIEIALSSLNLPVEFWVIGEGAMKGSLIEKIKKLKLSNIHIVNYQPRHLMPQLISYADLHFIFMKPILQNDGFPSKVYTILACQKPLLVISGTNTPLSNFLLNSKTSFLISDIDFDMKCEKVVKIFKDILTDKNMLSNMGSNGLKIINQKYSKQIVTNKYSDLINSLS